MAELPYYHKHSLQGKPTPLTRSPSGGFHKRTGILLIFILAVFATICLATLYYIPEISHPDDYKDAYRQFIGEPMSKSMKDEVPPLNGPQSETPPSTVFSKATSPTQVDQSLVRKVPDLVVEDKESVVTEKKKQVILSSKEPASSSEKPSTVQTTQTLKPSSSSDAYKPVGEGGHLDKEKRDKVKEVRLSVCIYVHTWVGLCHMYVHAYMYVRTDQWYVHTYMSAVDTNGM